MGTPRVLPIVATAEWGRGRIQPSAEPGFQVQQRVASLPLANTGEGFIGWMRPELWARMEATLREQGLLAAPLDVTQAYTLGFLQQIYAP